MRKALPYNPSCLASTMKPALRITSRYDCPTETLDSALSPLAPLSPLSPCNKSLPRPPELYSGGRVFESSSIISCEEIEGNEDLLIPVLVSGSMPPNESTMLKDKSLPIPPTNALPSLQIPVLPNAKREKKFGHSQGRAKKRINRKE
jgi:hypothetical protein